MTKCKCKCVEERESVSACEMFYLYKWTIRTFVVWNTEGGNLPWKHHLCVLVSAKRNETKTKCDPYFTSSAFTVSAEPRRCSGGESWIWIFRRARWRHLCQHGVRDTERNRKRQSNTQYSRMMPDLENGELKMSPKKTSKKWFCQMNIPSEVSFYPSTVWSVVWKYVKYIIWICVSLYIKIVYVRLPPFNTFQCN